MTSKVVLVLSNDLVFALAHRPTAAQKESPADMIQQGS
jgi:hypothetical protein